MMVQQYSDASNLHFFLFLVLLGPTGIQFVWHVVGIFSPLEFPSMALDAEASIKKYFKVSPVR
jgi:hypothetical protein